MLNPKLSLIIATYNIRNYIGECLKSCLNQVDVSQDEYEIIVVNDGSTDDSPSIVEQIIADHSNVRLLNKPNGGLSDARNYGLSFANGEYVWFIDGDDIITANAVSTILDSIKTKAQVYMIDYKELYPDGSMKIITFGSSRLPNNIFNACELIATEKIPFPPMMAWLQIQNRQFILDHELQFLKGVKSEDLEYTAKLFSVANRVSHIKKPLYFYRQNRSGSIINELNNDTLWIKNLLNICLSVSDYLFNRDASDKYTKKILAVLASMVIHNLYKQDVNEYNNSRKLIKQTGFDIYKMLMNGDDFKFKFKALLYRYTTYKIARHFFK